MKPILVVNMLFDHCRYGMSHLWIEMTSYHEEKNGVFAIKEWVCLVNK